MSAANDRGDRGEHVGELAELYALGVLEPHEVAPIEAHVAACEQCARAVGTAEATIAALDDAFVAHREPPERLASRIAASAKSAVPLLTRAPITTSHVRAAGPSPRFLAMAAALLLAVGVGSGALVERSGDVREAHRESAILATIATSHFNHVSLASRIAGVPAAKALYARDGAWFYVVVDSATCACRVLARSAAGRRNFGPPEIRGTTATLFVRDFPYPTSVDLVDASGSIIAAAPLVYSKR